MRFIRMFDSIVCSLVQEIKIPPFGQNNFVLPKQTVHVHTYTVRVTSDIFTST